MKRQSTEQERIFASDVTDNSLISQIDEHHTWSSISNKASRFSALQKDSLPSEPSTILQLKKKKKSFLTYYKKKKKCGLSTALLF